jgi:23S rRNA (uracil1939-C5)-methyltransferase
VQPDTLIEAEVIALGHSGDGVILHEARKLFAPYAAPGDLVELQLMPGEKARAAIVRIVRVSDARATPCCKHFGSCGGCALQHLNDAFVADWKRQLIIDALAHRGLRGVTVRATQTMKAASRRRAAFTAVHEQRGIRIGYSARNRNQLIAISECAVLDTRIVQLIPEVQEMLAILLSKGQTARLLVTLTQTGLDMDVHLGAGRKAEPGLRVRTLLAAAAERLDLARLSLNGITLLERRKPVVMMGAVPVSPPPGAFLQASIEGQAALITLVMEALGDQLLEAKGVRILDLFAGCGTFTFPIAPHARVHAVEGDAAMTGAMRAAARRTQGLKQMEISQRDLQRRPISTEELASAARGRAGPGRADCVE